MKRSFVLVSCAAVLLFLSNVSFAQEVVDAEVAHGACCTCGAAVPALPVYYYPAPKSGFGDRLAALGHKCPFGHKDPVIPPQVAQFQAVPQPAYAGGYPGAPSVGPLAARRAARLAPQPLLPYPPMPMPAPGVAPIGAPLAPHVFVAGPGAGAVPQLPATSMGDGNKVYQRASVGGAPVINFLSVVRAPRDPYAGYYQPAYPAYGYPQPVVE